MQRGNSIHSEDNTTWSIGQPLRNGYCYKCISGNLSGSSIVIIKDDNSETRNFTINLSNYTDDQRNILFGTQPQMNTSCHSFSLGSAFSSLHFRFPKNDEMSDQFLYRINLINEIAPLGKEILYKASSHAKTNLTSTLHFLMAMNFHQLPKELTQFIIFLNIQSEGTAFVNRIRLSFFKSEEIAPEKISDDCNNSPLNRFFR